MKKSVIFLNGPTCVGKTSIAKLLQAKLLPVPFMYISIDMMIDMMPEGINNWHGEQVSQGFWWKTTADSQGFKISHIHVGLYAEKVCECLKDVALIFLNNGHNLIIDEICLMPGSFSSWQQKLLPFSTLYVGLSASLEILEQREALRKDRMAGSARAQHALVHHGNTYDLNLNTGILTAEECSNKIIEFI